MFRGWFLCQLVSWEKKHVFGVVANLVNPAQPLIATEKHADYERPAVGVSLKDTRVMLSEFAT